MIKTIKNKLFILIAALTLAAPVVIIPMPAYASCSGNIANQVGSGVDTAVGNNASNGVCNTGSSLNSGVGHIARYAVNIFSIIVGIVSVIMIIYAGFRYVTSGGESGSVSSAQKTLIYAIAGLIVVVLAQLIVHYVLNTASTVSTPPSGG
ncbi:MAG: hypothetical protein ACYCPS_01755 [Candidatus Saccharimonadales bacterium]